MRRCGIGRWRCELRVVPAKALGHAHIPSYAGLTRVSIILQKTLAKKMDCRVKPGNDDRDVCMPQGVRRDDLVSSLLLDPRIRDQLLPDHELVLEEFLEFLGWPRKRFHPALAELLLDLGPVDDLLDFSVELQHDVLGQIS